MTATELIREIIESGENLSVADIARRAGVSRQRVHSIMRREGWSAKVDGRKSKAGDSCAHEMIGACVVAPRHYSKTTGGQISELLVAADLLALGYKPFQPTARASLFDVIAVNPFTGKVITIEVKTGRDNGGSVVFQKSADIKTRHFHAEPDHYAVVCPGYPIRYIPEIEKARRVLPHSLGGQ